MTEQIYCVPESLVAVDWKSNLQGAQDHNYQLYELDLYYLTDITDAYSLFPRMTMGLCQIKVCDSKYILLFNKLFNDNVAPN